MALHSGGAGGHAGMEGARRGDGVTENDETNPIGLVTAARDGDRDAADALIAAHLPLLYRVVGRALDGHADVDDVVQETVLRAYRDLPTLRTPASFRSWLVAIANHQISTRLRSWRQDQDRTVPLDDAGRVPDPEAEFADLTLLRMGLSDQRRQVVAATAWLDPDDREPAALWWREVAGELTRAEVVAALGLRSAHARVRLRRMRNQLDLSRFVVAALEQSPRCPQLDELARDWDGTPGPRRRKRFARHVRDCRVCGAARSGFVPLERLVLGASLVPLPAAAGGLAAGAVSGVAAGAGAAGGAGAGVAAGSGWFGPVIGVKVAAAVLAGATISGSVYLALPDPSGTPQGVTSVAPPAVAEPSEEVTPPRRTRPPATTSPVTPSRPAATPSATGLVPAGPVVLHPAADPGVVIVLDGEQMVEGTGAEGIVVTAQPGIADQKCLSLRSADGRYVRHASFRIVLNTEEDRDLYRRDATFCPERGAEAGTVRFRSSNYPDRLVRILDGRLRLDPEEKTAAYVQQSTFRLTTA
ncbi:sigma-70 family RNA polymerase sigma factor [Actinoplanes sp. Pm04-4]|uniref:RNA polymerase sigma factor n=1 Tax=Paractinoplanes pyxinae TaxID=2997416 RepID=A0ABT4AT06_9ACTN|nr:sigma-70 family RNA polymerase sigma factor [Actinoplanes pyxinae]MCY1136483.1 sigma-70 family RNA polymerase sigma factor [Actinoplanes pyxinae]